MTILLAIESSTELASIALSINGQLTCRELSGVQTHSQGLLPAIQALLADAGVSLAQCDAIAFGCGPGAFTGVRTACGIVQGLAFAADLRIVPVVSLHAMAYAASADRSDGEFVAMLDARMGEVYWARYRLVSGEWQVIVEPSLVNLNELGNIDIAGATLVLGKGIDTEKLNARNANVVHHMPHASQLAAIGVIEFEAGRALDPYQAQPLYVRNKIALTTAERLVAKESAQ
jgi:tRNA threonylcarbamoyladenosine biosynthesis protein TsaB